jgi:ERCC4-type nuclease
LTHFGGVEKAAMADPKSLAEIQGIGGATVRRIRWAAE